MNAGPARIPSIHRTMLGYCEELGIPLEVEINTSRSALMQSDDLNGGRAVEQRQIVYDTRGTWQNSSARQFTRAASTP
jgi:monoamine oxidase